MSKAAYDELTSLADAASGVEAAGLLVRAGSAIAESDPEAAARCWERAIQSDPLCAGAFTALADHHEKRQEWLRLLAALNQLISIHKQHHPSSCRDVFHRKGLVLLEQLASMDKAEQHFRLALTIDPNHVPSLQKLLKIADAAHRADDARELVRRLADLGVAEARVRAAALGSRPAMKSLDEWKIPDAPKRGEGNDPTDVPPIELVPAKPNGRHVLVVDSDAEALERCESALARDGFQVSAASSVVEAVAFAQARAIDAIVSEARMPGLSTVDLIRALRGARDVPIVLTAARPDPNDAKRAFELGVHRYLEKSADSATVAKAVARALGGGPRAEPPRPAPARPAARPPPASRARRAGERARNLARRARAHRRRRRRRAPFQRPVAPRHRGLRARRFRGKPKDREV